MAETCFLGDAARCDAQKFHVEGGYDCSPPEELVMQLRLKHFMLLDHRSPKNDEDEFADP
jgi:hypothetical protein